MASAAPSVPADPYVAFGALSDDEWRRVLLQTVHGTTVQGVPLPGFPDEATQVGFTSRKNEEALTDALAFYDIVRRAGREHGLGWSPSTRLLDFGAGWGRITRTFLKDVASENLFGVEVNPDVLATCQRIMPYGTFERCEIGQPLGHADDSIDVVTAVSVFSHLSEPNHLHWIREFHRVLRPGGIVVLTTLSRGFLQRCEAARTATEPDLFQQQVLDLLAQGKLPGAAHSFLDVSDDEFFYLPTGGGIVGTEPENYGWAIIPAAYGRRRWAPWFRVCEFADPMPPLDQAVFVLRKRTSSDAPNAPVGDAAGRLQRVRATVGAFVRRQPGGPQAIDAVRGAARRVRTGRAPAADPAPSPATSPGNFPYTLVSPDAMPAFDDLAEEYPQDRIPPLDRTDVDESALTWDQLYWRRFGYLVLPGFLPDELVDGYLALRARAGVGLGGFENTVWDGTEDEIKALGCYAPLAEKITELLGEELALNFTLTQFTSTEREWHQDDYLGAPDVYGRYCAVWMALGDVHPDSGPFQLVPGSHRWKGMRGHLVSARLVPEVRGWLGRDGEDAHWATLAECFTTPAFVREIERTKSQVSTFVPRRGDVLIWHGKLVHQGSKATVPGMVRPALICHYYPPSMKAVKTARYRDGGLYWPDKDS